MRPGIRIATADDAARLSALAERTFRVTFAADNSAEDMDAYVRARLSVAQLRFELTDAANTFMVAFTASDDEPCGYAKLRVGTADPSVSGADPIELERLYVDRQAHGLGVGAALMHSALDTARAAWYQTLWLGVWERNARAIAFYEKWGFRVVGDHVFVLGADPQRDLIMEREIPPAA